MLTQRLLVALLTRQVVKKVWGCCLNKSMLELKLHVWATCSLNDGNSTREVAGATVTPRGSP